MCALKITLPTLKSFDAAERGELDREEILAAPAALLARQFEVLNGSDHKTATLTFASLPLHKKAQIFENSTDFDFWKKEFLKLAKESPDDAVSLILQMKELPLDVGLVFEREQGVMGALYLTALDARTREDLQSRLFAKDPLYYQAILSVDEATLSRFERAQKFAGLVWTDGDKALSFLHRQNDRIEIWEIAKERLTYAEERDFLMNPEFRKMMGDFYPQHAKRKMAYKDEPQRVDGHYESRLDPQDSVIYLHQKEYALAQAASSRYLQTAGLGGCAVLTLWDGDNKIAAMAHFDGMQDIEDSIDLIIGDMVRNGADRSRLAAELLGAADTGTDWSKRTVSLIRDYLADQNLPLKRQDVLDRVSKEKGGVTFDLHTGEAFYHVEINSPPAPAFETEQNLIYRNSSSWGQRLSSRK